MKNGWVIALFAVLLAVGGGAAGAAYSYSKDHRLPQEFRVGGMNVGGVTAGAAIEQVRTRIAELENTKVTGQPPLPNATSDGKLASRTLKQLGMTLSADDAFTALERHRDRVWWERVVQRLQGQTGASYDLSVKWDEDTLQREARKTWESSVGVEPHDAKREINELDEVVYTPEVLGTQLDMAEMTANIKKLAPTSLAKGSAASGDKPHQVVLPLLNKPPQVTVASLKEQGIERKIAEFTTSFQTSGSGRSHNVTAAAKALNETLLMPGDIFEYGKIVSKAEKDYGYREAPVIVKGKLVPGIGGGICQVSSTLYNAILMAGLDVVERRNHSLVVHYLPPGLDATFADGYVNFRFRNSTGKQLLIRTVVLDKHMTVKLFGTLPDNVTYRTETEQLKLVEPKITYVGNPGLTLGQEKRLQKGEPGYIVDTYRVKYVDGLQVERVRMPRSNYRPQDELMAVHPDDPRLKPQDSTPVPTPDPGQGPVEPV
jgi:vancomycin resistance protein YoaR